ncbi:MAG: hypothetical protein ACW98D_16485 [Promethearchaeota archaeon]|jgi:hypothetical protein
MTLLTIICSIGLFIAIITLDDFNLNYIFTTLVDGIIIVVVAGAVNA